MKIEGDQVFSLPEPVQSVAVLRVGAKGRETGEDRVAEEVPVALEYNGITHVVMLATPAHLEEFALGFSLAEGLLQDRSECFDIDVDSAANGITVRMQISNRAFASLKERRRSLAGRTGCGLCGTESLEQVLRPLPAISEWPVLRVSAIRAALSALRSAQPMNQDTGCLHAAAWCLQDGSIAALYEDVGRHNALDKLIGAHALAGAGFKDGFVLITSRASMEMVQKAATVGIPAIVAISAPTALAVRTAHACGLTLVAFARNERFVAYAHADHIEY